MKKTLLAAALLASFTGAASAATSVTLWGEVDTAYSVGSTKITDTVTLFGGKPITDTYSESNRINMLDKDESRLGIKVKEDLGNGLSAFVRLEGALTSDVGSSVGFGRETVIGLSTNFGDVYFGRSSAPFDKIDIGAAQRSADPFAPYASLERFSNAAFYAYDKNGLSVYAALSTPGGQFANSTEQSRVNANPLALVGNTGNSKKAAYGLSAKYTGKINSTMGYSVGLGYQADNDNFYNRSAFNRTNLPTATIAAANAFPIGPLVPAISPIVASVKNEWLANATFTYNPVTLGLSYSRANYYTSIPNRAGIALADNLPTTAKGQRIRAFISAQITPNDTLSFQYGNNRDRFTDSTANALRAGGQVTSATSRAQAFGLGYQHDLSKRTAVYANAGRVTTKTTAMIDNGLALGQNHTASSNVRVTSYDIGVKHTF